MGQTSILDETLHGTIIAELSAVLMDANIEERFIHQSASQYVGSEVTDYIKRWPYHRGVGTYGLLVCGKKHMTDAADGMAAAVGALTRNFIRARVVTLQQFMADDDEDILGLSCVAVPNFLIGDKPSIPDWAIPTFMDKLMQRRFRSKQTLLYASSYQQVFTAFGSELASILKRDFIILE